MRPNRRRISKARPTTRFKRYEGSFIVSYEKFAYTDFNVPLSPLEASADPDAREP